MNRHQESQVLGGQGAGLPMPRAQFLVASIRQTMEGTWKEHGSDRWGFHSQKTGLTAFFRRCWGSECGSSHWSVLVNCVEKWTVYSPSHRMPGLGKGYREGKAGETPQPSISGGAPKSVIEINNILMGVSVNKSKLMWNIYDWKKI